MTLLQLVSEQTIPNLLPILRLRPERLIHLVTRRTAHRANALETAARAAGLSPECRVTTLSDMPGIPETFNAVVTMLKDLPDGGPHVVNFTGGTKLMSIGAYAAAKTQEAPSLYVDTQDACFIDGATSPEMGRLLGDDWSFTPLHSSIRVDTLGIANGVSRVTGGRPWEPMLPLAGHLFEDRSAEEATHAAIHADSGLCPHGREPRTPSEWLPLLDRPFALPTEVARLAVESGLVRPEEGLVCLPDGSRSELEFLAANQVSGYAARYFKAIAPVQQTLSFLTGGWWEVVVCDAARRSGLFRDLRWSAQVGERNGPDVEEDVLGVDGVELLYICCKRGGMKARLLPLLEEIRARATTIGGSFNRRFLAVLNMPPGKAGENFRQQALRLGIRILSRGNIDDPAAFFRPR